MRTSLHTEFHATTSSLVWPGLGTFLLLVATSSAVFYKVYFGSYTWVIAGLLGLSTAFLLFCPAALLILTSTRLRGEDTTEASAPNGPLAQR